MWSRVGRERDKAAAAGSRTKHIADAVRPQRPRWRRLIYKPSGRLYRCVNRFNAYIASVIIRATDAFCALFWQRLQQPRYEHIAWTDQPHRRLTSLLGARRGQSGRTARRWESIARAAQRPPTALERRLAVIRHIHSARGGRASSRHGRVALVQQPCRKPHHQYTDCIDKSSASV